MFYSLINHYPRYVVFVFVSAARNALILSSVSLELHRVCPIEFAGDNYYNEVPAPIGDLLAPFPLGIDVRRVG